MSDVWAINLLPVVKKQPEGKAGAPGTWSDEQLRLLVELRDVRRKEWGEIARALNRPLSSCHRRYEAITRYREPVRAEVALCGNAQAQASLPRRTRHQDL
jgi:hypothetical protein